MFSSEHIQDKLITLRKLETKSGKKFQETIDKGNLIIDSLKEISFLIRIPF